MHSVLQPLTTTKKMTQIPRVPPFHLQNLHAKTIFLPKDYKRGVTNQPQQIQKKPLSKLRLIENGRRCLLRSTTNRLRCPSRCNPNSSSSSSCSIRCPNPSRCCSSPGLRCPSHHPNSSSNRPNRVRCSSCHRCLLTKDQLVLWRYLRFYRRCRRCLGSFHLLDFG
ncbi:hypothetical protein BCR33DRAFT_859117 [Rhizoclosmatium globosum]|uniref:Uncharacterized protein n=1 Tax=Rhizoclosmatium globosum TaxID=329046 RepID=A0A1Y2AV44_9FUNG|nr:hypothetical protein BCR33DRAFT_859117 [Rhizoclosmatium globosum]|eukprot:ORY26441.1 hypothetical protein BCR33DRAFT_859117 [Rhizoclosmatium globosum]